MKPYSAVNLGPRVQVDFKGKGLTKQSMRDECNINLIVARYVRTGCVDHLATYGSSYGFATSVSFHEAMNVITKADQMFLDLPAEVRRRFNGEPGEFLDFVQNPENQEEMIKMGLANRREGVQPVVVEAAPVVESAPDEPEVSVVAEEPPTG